MGNEGKKFKIGDNELYFRGMSIKEKNEVDAAGVRLFNKLMQDADMLTVYETKKILEKRGINLNDIQNTQEAAYQKMMGLMSLMPNASQEQTMDINESIEVIKNDLMRTAVEISGYLDNTIERSVDSHKTQMTIQKSLYVVTEDGEDVLYYPSAEDIDNENDSDIISTISLEYSRFIGATSGDDDETVDFIAELEDSVAKMVARIGQEQTSE